MKVTKLNGYEIMSSVRYGKGAEEANQLGTAGTRNQGMLVLTANRPDMKLGANDRLVVNMGAAHKKSGLPSIASQQIDRSYDLPQGF